jgi:hypothetical protein
MGQVQIRTTPARLARYLVQDTAIKQPSQICSAATTSFIVNGVNSKCISPFPEKLQHLQHHQVEKEGSLTKKSK